VLPSSLIDWSTTRIVVAPGPRPPALNTLLNQIVRWPGRCRQFDLIALEHAASARGSGWRTGSAMSAPRTESTSHVAPDP
jgi:hypothetical protein